MVAGVSASVLPEVFGREVLRDAAGRELGPDRRLAGQRSQTVEVAPVEERVDRQVDGLLPGLVSGRLRDMGTAIAIRMIPAIDSPLGA